MRARAVDHRDPDPENRSALCGFGGDGAVVSLDDRVDDGQAQPGARAVESGVVGPGEPFEQAGRSSGSMPGPSSVTLSSAKGVPGPPRWQVIAVVTVTPGGVCTQALLSRLLTSWCSRA